ncbi:hypothetical protein CCACVL1_26696 [Corchorus capsularis]|uniref:Uncharacterized protein n=1 Tax=Corchorus capsularis TaxID=210143 RepID=A0A1R3GDL5_COCAP|nr:hypothetical protein CCACVL1_26696 [Corchorus capsularis]
MYIPPRIVILALAAYGAYNIAYNAVTLVADGAYNLCRKITEVMEMTEDAVMIITELRDEVRMKKEARMREEEEEEEAAAVPIVP